MNEQNPRVEHLNGDYFWTPDDPQATGLVDGRGSLTTEGVRVLNEASVTPDTREMLEEVPASPVRSWGDTPSRCLTSRDLACLTTG